MVPRRGFLIHEVDQVISALWDGQTGLRLSCVAFERVGVADPPKCSGLVVWAVGVSRELPQEGLHSQHQQDRRSVSGCLSCPLGPLSTEPGVRQNLFTGSDSPVSGCGLPVLSSFP